MKLLPFAVAAIAAVDKMLVRAGEISPGVALITQKNSSDLGHMIDQGENSVIAAPVVAVVDHQLPSIIS